MTAFYILRALGKGFTLTLKHILRSLLSWHKANQYPSEKAYFSDQNKGIVTVTYPYQEIPVPENGRYQLHNEIDDCIVCDKCADICPVDCIDIVAIKSHENIGKTSDGTSIRMYAEKFDIDMAKCCFCGLCTAVCPTQCLTMTPVFDFSTFEIQDMNMGFAKLSAQEALEKKQEYQAKLEEKQAAKATKNKENPSDETVDQGPAKPKLAFKRKADDPNQDLANPTKNEIEELPKPKIIFKKKDPPVNPEL
jgi:NADH-quinone oxidoreductase subunit I